MNVGKSNATFTILGDVLPADFAIKTGRPTWLDDEEPEREADAVAHLNLGTITSVNRDELPDGGAKIFALTIEAIIYVVPKHREYYFDFQEMQALQTVLDAKPTS